MKLQILLMTGAISAAALILAGCGGDDSQTGSPAASASRPAEPASLEGVTFEVAGLTGDAEMGKRLFRQCQACHTLEPGKNRVGPTLHGVIGRHAGEVPGFNYSKANAGSDIIWTEDVLFEYLENPRDYLPGTSMSFAGFKLPQQRADVIAYLKTAGGEAG